MRPVSLVATLAALAVAMPALAAASISDRLSEPVLKTMRAGARRISESARPSERSGEYLDVRCAFHAHSRLSHDSLGTEAQIVAGARAAGVRAVFMTEHPTADRRWLTQGLRGEKSGVLFVPGAELSDGLLVWRGEKAEWTPEMPAREALERMKGTDAVAFVAHPEKRTADADWELPSFAGMEIYNSHADALDSNYAEVTRDFKSRSPLEILSLLGVLKKYPREAFAAIWDEPVDVLKRWDALNVASLNGKRRVVGIAGNDAHQNVGISLQAAEQGLLVRDALGKTVGEVPRKSLPLLLLGGLTPGSTVLSHTMDPYDVSLGYVSTHLLAPEVTEPALFDALLAGRAYIAFDWIADPSGFRYFATADRRTVEMGAETRVRDRPLLTVRPNAPCQIRLLRNGQEVRRVDAAELTFEVREPGVYRAEAWVSLSGQLRPWVYTNPIYVR